MKVANIQGGSIATYTPTIQPRSAVIPSDQNRGRPREFLVLRCRVDVVLSSGHTTSPTQLCNSFNKLAAI